MGLSLIQPGDDRNILLEKMRGKLAGSALPDFHAVEKRRGAATRSFHGWGWKSGFTAAVLACNILYLTGRSIRETSVAAVKKAPSLNRAPTALGPNEQALFWAYALYDFNRLRSEFGIQKETIVDAGLATMSLRVLLPKIDAATKAKIDRYHPVERTAKK